jgi:hypothetical protein
MSDWWSWTKTTSTYIHAYDGLRLDKVGNVGIIVDTSPLVPETSTVLGTPRDKDVIHNSSVALLCFFGLPRYMERRQLEVSLHDRQNIGM